METVRKPAIKVVYSGKNITEDLTPFLVALSYTDKVKSGADEIALTLSDPDGLWLNEWYPKKKDILEVWIGYDNYLFPCGAFEIDDLSLSGPPDIITIRAMAAAISKKLRTKQSYAHENKTLRQLAEKIATDHGLTVQGEVNNSIVINRTSQYEETDLCFLNRVSEEFGYVFNIRADRLVFTSIYQIEAKEFILSLSRSDLSTYDFTDKTGTTYKKAVVKYSNPIDGKTIEGEQVCSSDDEDCTTEDSLEIRVKSESVAQAEEIAKSSLHTVNTKRQTGTFSLAGNVQILAGVNIEVSGFGRLSGIYHVTESTHSFTVGGGYRTNFGAKKVKEISKAKWR